MFYLESDIVLNEAVHHPFNQAVLIFYQIAIRADSNHARAEKIDDQVAHGIYYPRFLHIETECGVHGKFKDFPKRTGRKRKRYAEYNYKQRICLDFVRIEKEIDYHKSDKTDNYSRRTMQKKIVPPEPDVKFRYFSQYVMHENKKCQNKVNFNREGDSKFSFENGRQSAEYQNDYT